MHFPGRMFAAVMAFTVAALAATSGAEADLVSHKALYTMRLDSADTASEIAGLEGRMSLKVVEVCDGWTTEQRTVLHIVDSAGGEILAYTTFLSWESKDGQRFRFQQETRHDGNLIEEIKGEAKLDGANGGTAYLTKPDEMELALPPKTMFPMRHTEAVIADARAGKNLVLGIVFDGSAMDNPNDVSVFIIPIKDTHEIPGLAKAEAAWRMRLAFFAVGVQSAEPDIEIGLIMRDDGIAPEVRWVYDTFSVTGTMDGIELLSPEPC